MSSIRHAWALERDEPNERFVWRCACGVIIHQSFGAPVPCELISHPQEHGQLRGDDWIDGGSGPGWTPVS